MSILAVLGLTACEKTLDVADDGMSQGIGQVKNSLLQVRTRASGSVSEGATVAYPVTAYVFQGDECRAAQIIGDEGQTLNIPLTEGAYMVYAIGGASAEDYVLPSAADALTTSAIMPREGKGHGDLMTAKASVTLEDGEANTVTLGMERRVMMLQNVVLRKIPTAATAVSLTISPLWQSVTVGGNYSGTDGAYALNLEKQGDGRTWQSATTAFLLPPSSSPASITVRITTATGTRSYTYQTSDELEECYKINIEGTYTEAVGVTLSGTIEGAEWKGERTIRFDFDENGRSAAGSSTEDYGDDSSPSSAGEGSFPQAGDTYQNCYVLASQVAEDGESAEFTLLSPNEHSFTANTIKSPEALQRAVAKYGTDDISDWRPMSRSEISLLQAVHADLGIGGDAYYLFDDGGTVKQMHMQDGYVSTPTSVAAYVRPVATVSFTRE